jgi:peptidyl-prolyl cis-trans isomerase A (cyclophilin A)/peptidyl-prolyl cis-trans isomerase B (cyclophilin B)
MKSRLLLPCLFALLAVSAQAASPGAASPAPVLRNMAPAQAPNPLVRLATSHGEIVVELYPDKAPRTVANFLHYVNTGHYNGTIFHRAIDRFVVQGGGYTTDFQPRETLPPVPNEAANGLKNEPGTLAMAREYEPDSATAQFFINLTDNKYLNYRAPHPKYFGYCVFGKVVKGMDVAKRIALLPTGAGGQFPADVPLQTVVIEQAEVIAFLPKTAGPANIPPQKRKG